MRTRMRAPGYLQLQGWINTNSSIDEPFQAQKIVFHIQIAAVEQYPDVGLLQQVRNGGSHFHIRI